jgi:hypothetical protein
VWRSNSVMRFVQYGGTLAVAWAILSGTRGARRAPDCAQCQTRLGRKTRRKGSPCRGHTPPRVVRTPCRAAHRPRQACQTPRGPPSERTLRPLAGVGVWPVPGIPLRQGLHRCRWGRWPWCRPPAEHARPSCSPRGYRRGVTGAVAAAWCSASVPRGTVVSPHLAGAGVGPCRGDAAVRQKVTGVSPAGSVHSREGWAWSSCLGVRPTAPVPPGAWHHLGILPGCEAHRAQPPSRCAGPSQAGRRGASRRRRVVPMRPLTTHWSRRQQPPLVPRSGCWRGSPRALGAKSSIPSIQSRNGTA